MLIARSYARDRTKTKTSKRMPIHPVLHTLLVDWIEHGFPEMFGRSPGPDDFVVPRPPNSRSKFGAARDKNMVRKKLLADLDVLDLRHRRNHDLRRSFITHAQQDGAAPHVLIRLTHPSAKKATAFAGYTEFQWADYCREFSKLQVEVPADFGVVLLPMVVHGEFSGDDDDDRRPHRGPVRRTQPHPRSGSRRAPNRRRCSSLQFSLHKIKKPWKIQGLVDGGAGSRTRVREPSGETSTCVACKLGV